MAMAIWLKNKFYNTIQSLILVVSLAALLGIVGWMLGGMPFALSAIAAMVLLYVFAPKMSPFVILRVLRGRPLSYREAPHLYAILESLAQRAALPSVPILYYYPADVMNAFTVGSPGDAAIALSEGLLRRLNRSEVRGVLAHEVSHIRSNDMQITGFADLANRLTHGLSFFGQLLLIVNLPLIMVGDFSFNWTAILLLIFAPTVSALLQLALSRTREYHADIGAVELMGDPESLATALVKIENHGRALLKYLPWIVKPQSLLLRTHPPTNERIRRLIEIQRRNLHLTPKFGVAR
ncbi:MAG: zinc metalloprotease HtpX [Desulfobacterales bacterium]